MDERRIVHSRLAGIAGIAAGALAGFTTIVLAGTAVAHRLAPATPTPVLEATHLPPLLTVPGERVELRYDVFCAAAETIADTPCPATGSVFVRTGATGPFRKLPLGEDRAAAGGRFAAVVPEAIARSASGFSYYAVLRSAETGAAITLPSGGASAPQRSIPLDSPVYVALGAHTFGPPTSRSARVVEAAWGAGPGQVGLEQGRNLTPIGGAAFDVSRDGTIHLLDEANRRVLRWRAGARLPARVPVAINGTLADMSVAGDGTIHVLETTKRGGDSQLLRSFSASGVTKRTTAIGQRASQVRLGPGGSPLVLQQPSGQWVPATTRDGSRLGTVAQRRSGRSGRPLATGGEIVVLRRGSEIRVSLLGKAGAQRSWRVTSRTPLAEVQLADMVGNRVVLVVRVYTDARDEFLVLQLGASGLVKRLALDSADWAETAPVSRFRLVGSSLYQLGSTPAGLFVDRFDLEVR